MKLFIRDFSKQFWCLLYNTKTQEKTQSSYVSFRFQSSHQRCYMKKDVLINFSKLTGKHLCRSLFLNKVAGLKACNFIEKKPLAQVFSCEFCEICKNTFFTEHLCMTASFVCYCFCLAFLAVKSKRYLHYLFHIFSSLTIFAYT